MDSAEVYQQKMRTERDATGTLLQYEAAVYLGVSPACPERIAGILEFRSRGLMFFSASDRFVLGITGGAIQDAEAKSWAEAGLTAPETGDSGLLLVRYRGLAGETTLAFQVEWPEVLAAGVRKIRDDAQKMARDAAAGGDVFDRLQKLAGLRDAGVLTEEEFAAQKAKLLERI